MQDIEVCLPNNDEALPKLREIIPWFYKGSSFPKLLHSRSKLNSLWKKNHKGVHGFEQFLFKCLPPGSAIICPRRTEFFEEIVGREVHSEF